jgi:hypothetical protein
MGFGAALRAASSGESQTANSLGGHVHADSLAALVTGELEHKSILGLKHVAEQIRQRGWFDSRSLQDELPGVKDKGPCHIQFPAVIRSRERPGGAAARFDSGTRA